MNFLLISSLMWLLYCMYVYILYLFEKIFFIHIATKLLTNSIFPIVLMVRSGISEASHK